MNIKIVMFALMSCFLITNADARTPRNNNNGNIADELNALELVIIESLRPLPVPPRTNPPRVVDSKNNINIPKQ